MSDAATGLIVMMLREGLQDSVAHNEDDRARRLSTAIAALCDTNAESEIEAIKRKMRANDDGPSYDAVGDES